MMQEMNLAPVSDELTDVKSDDIIGNNEMDSQSLEKITHHAAERRQERNISSEAISDALSNPIYVEMRNDDQNGRRSTKYIGIEATVVINPDTGRIITVWRTGSKIRKKYVGGNDNEI